MREGEYRQILQMKKKTLQNAAPYYHNAVKKIGFLKNIQYNENNSYNNRPHRTKTGQVLWLIIALNIAVKINIVRELLKYLPERF